MEIEAFLLCDAATDQQGKLNVLGAFNPIFTRQIPYTLPSCAIAARMRFEKIESGSHPLKINLIDEDGHGVGPKVSGKLDVQVPDNLDSLAINFIFQIRDLTLNHYGKYRIDLAVDGQIQNQLPFRVVPVPNQPQQDS